MSSESGAPPETLTRPETSRTAPKPDHTIAAVIISLACFCLLGFVAYLMGDWAALVIPASLLALGPIVKSILS